jgi:hypothetical protein
VARRRHLPPSHETAREFRPRDRRLGARAARPQRRRLTALARLVLAGTPLVVIWTIADEERRFFAGATWDRMANTACSRRWARTLQRAVPARVRRTRHGHTLLGNGARIVNGYEPGRKLGVAREGRVPHGSTCD